jgi:double-stranded uracil-DNA glycosylase
MGEVFGTRVVLLQSVGVALWGTLQACTRPGSRRQPNIPHVFFNGSKPEKAFRRHVLPALREQRHLFLRLPSTSPAHAAMRPEAKVQALLLPYSLRVMR